MSNDRPGVHPLSMMSKVFQFLSSLRLTVVLLALGVAVVFFGTLGQTSDGLYVAQERYFRSWFALLDPAWSSPSRWCRCPAGTSWARCWSSTFIVAHFTRFQWTWAKSGIFLTHIGIILLLLGQLATDMLARESIMSFREGDTRNFSESAMDFELAVMRSTGSNDLDQVVAIPASRLRAGAERSPRGLLPFAIRVQEAYENAPVPPASAGHGFQPSAGGEPGRGGPHRHRCPAGHTDHERPQRAGRCDRAWREPRAWGPGRSPASRSPRP
jgi:hypothetical protein